MARPGGREGGERLLAAAFFHVAMAGCALPLVPATRVVSMPVGPTLNRVAPEGTVAHLPPIAKGRHA
ncbi:hypothetical protein [Komagataeibacter swingsii]|uniref:hypothetical protein n=1 Tax=Komagataeibacter swingsii TaxID=215220 RepID=UPI0011B45E27|nr:hypothetical protein [Komagataeibacter swingsii]